MAKKNRTVHAILGFLTWKPMSGYDIKKAIDSSISNFWSESYGQIYPILKRLAADGLIVPGETRANGGRQSQTYGLTAAGRAALRHWLEQPPEPEPPRNEFLLKLFFGRHNAPASNERHVVRFREAQLQDLERYDAIERRLRADRAGHPDLPYWLMTLSYGKAVRQGALAWCDETLAELRRLPATEPGARADPRSDPNCQTYEGDAP